MIHQHEVEKSRIVLRTSIACFSMVAIGVVAFCVGLNCSKPYIDSKAYTDKVAHQLMHDMDRNHSINQNGIAALQGQKVDKP